MLATTGDYLRLWHVTDDKVELKAMLNNKQNSEYCAPLTSFDWNENDTNRIGTCSIDTTCTIWDIEKEVVDTQLIAHDKEVSDETAHRIPSVGPPSTPSPHAAPSEVLRCLGRDALIVGRRQHWRQG